MSRVRTSRLLRGVTATASALVLSVGLAACGGSESASGDDEKSISIGIPSGWDEGIAVSHLWKAILEDEGYEVETETADVGVVFTGLAGGDFDVTFDTWLPLTHASYLKKFGDDITDLGTWYDNAKLTIAVNESSPAKSLEDLAGMADEYGNRLVGIEAGAGLTKVTQEEVVPTYGLDKMDYVISSTPAMLAELKSATKSGDNIAVTLWRPHWAYDEFPMRDLEDPKGTLGEAEEIHAYGSKDFGERFGDVEEMIGAFTLNDEQLFSLENLMFNSGDDVAEEDAVKQWLEDNPTFVDDLKKKAGVS
ncbi:MULTISPECIES: glycine betaine ABC transporter substrate-binding protein [Mumia]|uniref:glycine betaine ABC transporter substrate-binding protein n=1 Tax=Mumia TaxID=1546255 RepID=UPI0014237FB1|nr:MULTISPECIES: glycine betaine ABC transporter substrate-binding protein [unclassified Mumia]QMW67542.1 glycine betaine ABC transporter substrate-binding protein [Mumia sp. ZJ1417]